MSRFETWLNVDLKKPNNVTALKGRLFTQDAMSNLVGVNVFDNDTPVDSLSGSVIGWVMRADGNTLVINGEKDGNKAYIVLPEAAYAVVGNITIAIQLVDESGEDEVKTTLTALTGYVYRTTTDTIIDPGEVVPDLTTLLAEIEAMEEATEAANDAADAANAAAEAVSGDIAELNSKKDALYNDSANFQDYGTLLLTRGQFGRDLMNPNTGSIGTTRPYRISSRVPIVFPYDVTLKATTGFRFYYYTWDGSTWVTGSWKTEYTLTANTQYHLQIARETEDTSENADIVAFIKTISVTGGIISDVKKDIAELQSEVDVRDVYLPIAVSFEQGRYAYCEKQDDTTRIRSKLPIYVHAGDKVIVYSETLYTYVGLTEKLDSKSYLQTSNWKHQDTTMLEYTFVAEYDGYITINVAQPDRTSNIVPADFDGYIYISKNHDIPGKHLHVYQFGGKGNDWCFIRTPADYNPSRAKPYPFVICNHGNSWVMDGSIEKANWTKRTMYIPDTDPDAGGTQFNVTDDKTLWYSNPTIEALLTAGYIVCGCENYADNLYGNNNCRNACVDFFHHMVDTYNVENRCYMIGASNGAMTSLNAAYLLQGAVKAMILQYPITCLVNQYESYSDHQAGIRAAYGITDADITAEELAIAVATHDPLTVDVVSGKKVGVFPPTAIYYSQSDAVVNYQQNTIALADMLTASNKVVKTVKCSGQHGDKSMFVPTDFVAWFDAN